MLVLAQAYFSGWRKDPSTDKRVVLRGVKRASFARDGLLPGMRLVFFTEFLVQVVGVERKKATLKVAFSIWVTLSLAEQSSFGSLGRLVLLVRDS